jgi:hypothetical protein
VWAASKDCVSTDGDVLMWVKRRMRVCCAVTAMGIAIVVIKGNARTSKGA